MAKEMTLLDYHLKPIIDSLAGSIAIPKVEASNFELNPALISLISKTLHFGGLHSEDPIWHLRKFLRLAGTVKYDGIPTDAIRLMLFRFSVTDKVNVWLSSLPTGSITTWVELTRRFLAKYLPPANFSKLRRADYVMMPIADILADSIAIRGVEAKNFEINPDLISLISDTLHFGGLPSEDPILHLSKFLMFTDTVKYDGVPTDVIRLMLFRFSVTDMVDKWLSTTLPDGSITTWNELTHHFLAKYFPLEKSAKLRGDIYNFTEFEHESLYEAWEHFRELIGKCPNHGLSISQQVEIFYNGISYTNRLLIDAACRGSISIKTPEEAYSLIEKMANNSNPWQ